MKRKQIRLGLAILLCAAILLSLSALAVFEADEIPEVPAVSERNTPAELPELPVEIPSDDNSWGEKAQPLAATVFSVTVPTTVAIHMDASGGITCGNITITNNSSGAVLIKDAQVSALNGWTLMDYATTTFTDANKGQHKIALQLGAVGGAISANGGSKTIGVSAKIPRQGAQVTNVAIAQVVFVLGWESSVPNVPAEALKSFTITVVETGSTRNGGSWSDSDTVELHAVSQVGNNVLYEGSCTITAPYNNYCTNLPYITNIPDNLANGIMSIRVGSVDFVVRNGSWSGNYQLFDSYSTGGTFDVQVELSLDTSITVKDPTPSTPSPSPTSTPTPTPT